ncbi:hypothetical protein NQ176_g2311 [Zarea fungicola]|uniref:Uncharacterized protein n=1 Tax=Zarea fungicola TaxID=93591 RepID=A0ACC1NRK6_9HYPO|nr:hypothetical protein NQ176_g2311 [Lecanicillium fungicola]
MRLHATTSRPVRLSRMLLAASIVLPAWVAASSPPLPYAMCSSSSEDNCPPKMLDNLTVLKCNRCKQDIPSLMKQVAGTTDVSPQDQQGCYNRIDQEEHYPFYLTGDESLTGCVGPRNLLYDGAVGNTHDALFKCMQPCFAQATPPPNTLAWCPSTAAYAGGNLDSGVQNAKRSQRPVGTQRMPWPSRSSSTHRARTSKAERSNDDDDGDDSDDGDIDKRGYPPDVEEQFSPVLDDVDISFYIDINERGVLVNSSTYEIIKYDPYWLYPVPSFDQIIDSDEPDLKWLRRNYFYPQSNRVWYYQWLVESDVYSLYGTDTSTDTATVATSIGYTATTSYSVTQTKTDPAISSPINSHDANAASSSSLTKTPDATAASSSNAASSTAASHLVPFSWLMTIQLLAIACYVF